MSFAEDLINVSRLLDQSRDLAMKFRRRKNSDEFQGQLVALIAYRLYSEDFVGFLEAEEQHARKFGLAFGERRYALEYLNIDDDDDIDDDYVDYMRDKRGYFLFPSQLFNATLVKTKKNLRRFYVLGRKTTLEESLYEFFEIVEPDDPTIFTRYFSEDQLSGSELKTRSIKLSQIMNFVNSMTYEIMEHILNLL